MKHFRPLLTALLCVLVGCQATPRVTIDPKLLDTVPAISIELPDGSNATGMLRRNGLVLTCSHVVPRGQGDGLFVIAGHRTPYRAASSGDSLRTQWSTWAGNDNRALSDWVLLKSDSVPEPDELFGPTCDLTFSAEPPRPGETVFLVGYTREGASLIRYWAPLLTVPAPSGHEDSLGSLIWLQTENNVALRRGFSGSPILRLNAEGRLEVCAMFHGYFGSSDAPGSLGIAIPLPVFDN